MIWAGTAWNAVAGFARKVPWQVVVAVVLVAAVPINGCIQHRQGYKAGVASVEQRLIAAEADALVRASEAAGRADKKAEERALAQADARSADIAAIEKAEADDTNPLDSLF